MARLHLRYDCSDGTINSVPFTPAEEAARDAEEAEWEQRRQEAETRGTQRRALITKLRQSGASSVEIQSALADLLS